MKLLIYIYESYMIKYEMKTINTELLYLQL